MRERIYSNRLSLCGKKHERETLRRIDFGNEEERRGGKRHESLPGNLYRRNS
jgi:hypothetical protein